MEIAAVRGTDSESLLYITGCDVEHVHSVGRLLSDIQRREFPQYVNPEVISYVTATQ